MIIISICVIALLIYLIWKWEAIENANIEKIVQEETEAYLIELLQNQNDLNNAAFAARKALIQEALKSSYIDRQSDLHDGM